MLYFVEPVGRVKIQATRKILSDTTQQNVLEEIYYPTHQIAFFLTLIQFVACALRENLSNRSSGVEISRDICTRIGRYLYSTKCSWIVGRNTFTTCIKKTMIKDGEDQHRLQNTNLKNLG